ncbi:MAG TPA: cobalamin-dependent protein, partial [Vicinamibacteria bacterium]|nr:cobalamin-dependent protein [Vicinamibacteria bacterium]
MRVLLVQPRSPVTYWSHEQSLPFIGKSTLLPPLGLVTLAALLPERWDLRLRDLNVAPLADADLVWADVVLLSGMLVQADSMRGVLRRARAAGRRTVVGGPAATGSPELFDEADHLFLGEAEGRLELLVATLEAPGSSPPRRLSPEGEGRPDLALARVPRFDLLDTSRYANQALQYSRGCPFHCEFCDIVELYGNVPRVKTPSQVVAELDAVYACGARGALF